MLLLDARLLLLIHNAPGHLTHPACQRPRAEAPQCSRKSRRRRAAEKKAQPPDLSRVICDEDGFCKLPDRPFDDDASQLVFASSESGNPLLPTPAAYEELLSSQAGLDSVTIVRYGAPWCRSCRTIGPRLQALAAERWPSASFYELSLLRNGKAAGERALVRKSAGLVSPYFPMGSVGASRWHSVLPLSPERCRSP